MTENWKTPSNVRKFGISVNSQSFSTINFFESFEPKKPSYFLFLTNAKQKILTSVRLLISFWTLIKFWLQRNLILNNFLYLGTNLRWHQYTSSFAVESYAYVPKNIDIGVLREMLHSFF